VYHDSTVGKRREAVRAKVERVAGPGRSLRIFDIDGLSLPKDPKRAAWKALAALAERLEIAPDLSDLVFDEVRRSVLGTHVTFQQHHDGRPVTGAWVRVDLDPQGRVYGVQSDLLPVTDARPARPDAAGAALRARKTSPRAEPAAVRRALGRRAGKRLEVLSREAVAYPVRGVPVPATKLVVRTHDPEGEWKVYLDDATGKAIDVQSLRRDERAGKARVFDPHPVASLDDTTLTDRSALPDRAYAEVRLEGLDGTGRLDGKYATTRLTRERARSAEHDFRFRRGERGFAEAMAYFHVDRVQRRLQALGIVDVLARPLAIDVAAQAEDNSHYSLVTKDLHFGTGGVDDAEDGEIVAHEYGHAIQDAQMPGFGASAEAAAMGEGFGDYLAASTFAERKPERLRACVGSWDAVAYASEDPPCLRRVDSTKRYPRDVEGEPHADGEIWSACLWELRAVLGADATDRLVLAHHHLVTPRATFRTAATALLTADRQLSEGKNAAAIRDVFERRGILARAARSRAPHARRPRRAAAT
jgi:hypothetical protein